MVAVASPVHAQVVPSPTPASPPPLRITTPAQTVGTFLGGGPTGTPTTEPIKLTVIDAILRALDHNLGPLTAEEGVGRAQGARWTALSHLLPDVRGGVDERRQTINLAAFGFGSGLGSPFPDLPTVVGPFNVFDARVFVSQAIVDVEALRDAQSEAHALDAARLTRQSARDFVIHVAGNAFIQALASTARVDAAQAQFDTAAALYRQATDLKQSGIIAGLDVLRAPVEMSPQQQ